MLKQMAMAGSLALTLSSGAVQAGDSTVFEIAWFKLLPSADEAQMMEGAQHVQDHFLPRFDGRIYRELMAEDGGEYWIDSIHWRSLGNFRAAAAEILTDPDGAAIMELIDVSTMAWFHADRVRHWPANDVPRGTGFTEIRFFRLVGPGAEVEFLTPTNDEEFLAAADDIQPLIAAQEGFADRELFRTEDGWWIDLVHWKSKENAQAVEASLMAGMIDQESAAYQFLAKIDPKSVKTFQMNQKLVW